MTSYRRGMILMAAVAGLGLAPTLSHANWLTHILKEAGQAGEGAAVKAGKSIAGPLDDVLRHVKTLPETAGGGTALAAAGVDCRGRGNGDRVNRLDGECNRRLTA